MFRKGLCYVCCDILERVSGFVQQNVHFLQLIGEGRHFIVRSIHDFCEGRCGKRGVFQRICHCGAKLGGGNLVCVQLLNLFIKVLLHGFQLIHFLFQLCGFCLDFFNAVRIRCLFTLENFCFLLQLAVFTFTCLKLFL